jgi:hypothetical protein
LEALAVTALRLTATAILAAAAVLAALLAADVRAWPVALENGDAVYAIAPGRARWVPATNLGDLSNMLLGTAGDVAARLALQAYRDAADVPQPSVSLFQVPTQRLAAINALSGPANSANPHVAAQARTLLGILIFAEVTSGGGVSTTDTAVAEFADAVRIEPGDTAAKFDLELLLRLTAANGQRSGHRLARGFGRTGHGASGAVSGSGF